MNTAKKTLATLEVIEGGIKNLTSENRRILVVEDERQIAQTYVDILGEQNHNSTSQIKSSRFSTSKNPSTNTPPFIITVCRTPDEALAIVKDSIQKNKPFAMGFFDVLLNSTIDGIELVRQIFEIDQQMLAVFVTAYQDRTVDAINDILGLHNSERWDYLNKPFSEGEILQKARNLVSVWNLKQDREQKNQQLIEATKRLMSSDRVSAVATVARSVGHEFGNILLQISGTAELNQNASEDKMKKALKTILSASDTASQILEKFKDLSLPADAQSHKEYLVLNDVVDEAYQLMEHQFETSGIRFCLIKNDKVKLMISRTSIVQVLVNILINATHVMPRGGQIDVSIAVLGQTVQLRIHDYGPGIPKDVMDKIFDPFFTTKGEKGTGVGLAICREIIEIEHAGRITANNHVSKGAEFVIELPINKPENS